MQLSRTSSKAKLEALQQLHAEDYEALKSRLSVYRASLSEEVYGSQDYAFRVFLVPKPANRASASDLTMEFLDPSELEEGELAGLQRQITLIKSKRVPIVNKGLLKPSQVVELLKEVESRFRMHEHILAWKAFGVRPAGHEPEDLGKMNPEYCAYDEPNRQYLYTQKWVSKLKKFCEDPNALDRLREMQAEARNEK